MTATSHVARAGCLAALAGVVLLLCPRAALSHPTFFGDRGNDILRGTSTADVLRGRNGNDHLLGERGNDRLFGGAGADRLVGGAGADRLDGGAGNDRLIGGPGNDRLIAGAGRDRVFCGRGRDVAIVDSADYVAIGCETVRRVAAIGLPPGLPVPEQLPAADLCKPSVLIPAIRELVGIQAPTAPIEPGRTLGSDPALRLRLVDGPGVHSPSLAAAYLRHLVRTDAVTLAFSYELTNAQHERLRHSLDAAGAPMNGDITGASLDGLPTDFLSGLAIRPNVIDYASGPEVGKSIVNLAIKVKTELKGCLPPETPGETPGVLPVEAVIRHVQLEQLPIRIPTIVVGFNDQHWSGDRAIIFVRAGPSLVTGSFDRRDPTATVRQVQTTLSLVLGVATTALKSLASLFPSIPGVDHPSIPGVDHLDWVSQFADRLRDFRPSSLVITGERSHDDLGDYNPSLFDELSSVLMLGAPGGNTLRLYADTRQQGSDQLHLRIPANFIAASYWTIHESAFDTKRFPDFRLQPAIPDPGREQEDRAKSYPHHSFGNIAKSFAWVE